MKNQMIFQRYELKYLLTLRQQQALLAAMQAHMEPDPYSHSSIRNLYLDTPDFRLIRRSLEKPVYKEKLRIRSYGRAEPEEQVFVELKKKYRSVVYKRRLTMAQGAALDCAAGRGAWPDSQVGGELAYAAAFYPGLAPAVFLSYERDSFRGREDGELRVTFDTAVRYRRRELTLASDPWGTAILPPDQVLMEVKAARALPLWLARALSEARVYRTSFSKYGSAYRSILLHERKGVQKYA